MMNILFSQAAADNAAPVTILSPVEQAEALFGPVGPPLQFDEFRPRRSRRTGEESVLPLHRRGRLVAGHPSQPPVTLSVGPGGASSTQDPPALVHLACSLMGPFRSDLVDLVTRSIQEAHGNIEDSRITRLGAEFSMLVLVSLEQNRASTLQESLESLARLNGLGVLVRRTTRPAGLPGARRLRLEFQGLDHEGLVRTVLRQVSLQGLQVEDLEVRVTTPGGTFVPRAVISLEIQIPGELPMADLEAGLERLASTLDLDLTIHPEEAPAPSRDSVHLLGLDRGERRPRPAAVHVPGDDVNSLVTSLTFQ